ncbi:hypothetical protein NX059_006842 [Plenodomus lindquistii]|nr:hypothetical protein NX059_006842 [Plenodomus lindquistii]
MAFGSSDGNEFFNSWELWQKMTFVLAAGIVVTIFLGFLKVAYNRYRLRKYSKVDKGKQAQTPEMLEAQPVTQVSTETKEEIPFGIRAIQSGIEVEGVYISRSNTPVGSSRNSVINSSQLELPKSALLSSRDSSRAPSTFDRAVSAENPPSYHSRASSPGHASASNSTPRYSTSNAPRNSVALQTLEGSRPAQISGPPSPHNGQPGQSGSTSQTSSRTSDESDYMAIQDARAYETAYMRQAANQSPIDPRTDLDLLRSHRMSHVAETGQLTPRVRKPGNSGEWASVADNQVSTINGVNYFNPQKTPSPPYPVIDHREEVGMASSSGYADDRALEQARQAMPLTESYAPNAPYYPDTYEPRGPQHQYSYDEVPYEVKTEQNQQHESQVLRSVNSGFQVLKPGTFQPQTPEEMELAERRQSKKLQKKRRTSGDSRKSAFTEQV